MHSRLRASCLFVLAGIAWSPALSNAAGLAAGDQAPLLHMTAAETACAQIIIAIPGSQQCAAMGFSDSDVWVFRDRTASAVYERQAYAGFESPRIEPTASSGHRALDPAAWSALGPALAAAQVGTGAGRCNPLDPLVSFPPAFPRPVLHARIVWWGANLRTNVLDLGTEYTELCSPALRALFTRLRVMAYTTAVP